MRIWFDVRRKYKNKEMEGVGCVYGLLEGLVLI